jgi:hypothetical protein
MNPILSKKSNDSEQFFPLYLQLKIQVKPGSPRAEVNSVFKKNMKAAIANLYKAKPAAHDLSGFEIDPGETMVMYNTHT